MRVCISLSSATNWSWWLSSEGSQYFDREVVNSTGYSIAEMFEVTAAEDYECTKGFIGKYITESKVRRGLLTFTEWLTKHGHEYFVMSKMLDMDTYYDMDKETVNSLTMEWCKKNFYDFTEDRVLHFRDGETKSRLCKREHVDLVIEDSPYDIPRLATSFPVVIIKSKYNENIKGPFLFQVTDFCYVIAIIKALSCTSIGQVNHKLDVPFTEEQLRTNKERLNYAVKQFDVKYIYKANPASVFDDVYQNIIVFVTENPCSKNKYKVFSKFKSQNIPFMMGDYYNLEQSVLQLYIYDEATFNTGDRFKGYIKIYENQTWFED